MKSLYEHAGGEQALHRVEELFYSKVLADPTLSTLFTERRPHHVDHLTWFTAESLAGPDRFTRELGFRHIIDVHRHLKITDEQRERFVALYLESIDEVGLPNDEPFREAVRSHLEFGSRVAQQNSWAETEGDLHPIREVPRRNWPEKVIDARVRARARAHEIRRSKRRGAAQLCNVLADVPSQDFVDEGLIPDAAATCFLAELIEHSRIDANRDQLARLVAEERATDAPHRLQLLWR